ncbi:restriction endonuclease subunit S [Cronobacter sakazakii]|uniref:restriction endonuclease subunit S n=1 Tax=Cronobacter sakazakii TaxID=28141 RepID=UPI000DA142A7|nr:restriction endonuclease subunit S [Cronobacter sakazakii]ELY3418327.1 restriction endonuclease subunit S [Cronobacter sakazakii]ELY4336378.1 restriction endonuclease subunit S [Cronobacter sakazakii]HAU5474099.1 restriction endonuclease subunit S [Cronobacter sakazakii]
MSFEFIETELGNFVEIVTKKCDASIIDVTNYISTENMLPDRQGVTISSGIPDVNKFNSFEIGDTLFSNIRTYFKKVWFATFNGGVSPDVLVFRATHEKLTNEYLHLILSSDEFIYYSYLTSKGAKMPRGDKGAMLSYKIKLPSLKYQKRCTKLIFTLSKKIDSNNRINQTLEQMAQALFKSWFIDFEPVKAKMAVLGAGGSQEDATLAAMTAISGKDANALAVFERERPEHYAELKATAELFPSAMQDSELGEIPEGWELKSFGDVSKCYDKKRIPLSKPQREKKKGEIPYYGATSIMDYVDEYIFDGIYLLLGEDGSVIKENGLPFTQYIWGKSWVNNHAHVLTGSGSVTTEHLMVFIKQENIAAYVTGAVQMKLNQKNMNSIPFIFADEAVNNVFGQRIDSIYAVIRAKSEENLTLTNLRDTLLPKLLSGEITLPEAEQIISEEA